MAKQTYEIAFELAGKLNSSLKGSFNSLSDKMKELDKKSKSLQASMRKLEADQKKGAITAGEYTAQYARMGKELEKTQALRNRAAEIRRLTAAQQKNAEAITETRNKLLKTVGAASLLGAALYSGPVKAAMELESQMAEVSKVVDWIDKSGTAAEIEQYKKLKAAVLDVTTAIPMTQKEITEIMAAAGQAGVAYDNAGLVRFTSDAAKMGIAFDSSAEQAGEWMAKWRTSFKMTQDEVITLSDKINYLGNTSAAKALEISDVVTRIGPLGEVAGIASGEIAALGATLIATGVQTEVASTGIKNAMLEMTAGKTTKKRKNEVLAKLGFDAEKLAKRMQTDATGAILDFMKALKRLPEAEQSAALNNYFGRESIAAIAPLLTNIELLEENFRKVGDAAAYAGSMEAEYAARADTTENKVQLAKNSITKLGVVFGDSLLPYLGQGAEKMSELSIQASEFVEENSEAIKTVIGLTGGLMALKIGGLAAKLSILQLKGGMLSAQKVIKLFAGDTVIATKGMSKAATAAKLAKGSFAMMAGPVGVAAVAVTAVTAGVVAYKRAQEKARQQTLNFSKSLKTAADNFQQVNSNVSETKSLIAEYRKLDAIVKDVSSSSDDVAAAKQRIKEIEDLLIEQNPQILSKYDQENGRIADNLELLEKKTDGERRLAKIKYEQAQYEAEKALPNTMKEIANLKAKTKALDEQYESSKNLRTGLLLAVQELEALESSNLSFAEIHEQAQQIYQDLNALGREHGVSWNLNSKSAVESTEKVYAGYLERTWNEIEKANEELNTATQSVKEFYDTSVMLTEIDLGGSFQSAADKLVAMNAELAALEEKGQGGSERALELKDMIADLEAKLEAAAIKIRDFGLAIESVPEVKTVNVEDALKDIDRLIEKLKSIPPSRSVQLITQQSGGSVPGYASGGIIKRPTLATFAERGPEAAIPLNRSQGSVNLWQKTGELLGVGRGGGNTYNITYAPVIPGSNAAEVEAVLKADKEDLLEQIKRMEHQIARTSYDS